MSCKIIALDPGNSTGWVVRENVGELVGGTIPSDHQRVWNLLLAWDPEEVVFETFQMYPGKAQKLIWNTFYPCEVIGVIKLYCQVYNKKITGLQPSVKKFALGFSEQELWKTVDTQGEKPSEHLRDAVRLLRYYERNK